MNLSLDLILGVEPAVLFLLLPSCVQLAGSPRAEPEARTCVGVVYSGKEGNQTRGLMGWTSELGPQWDRSHFGVTLSRNERKGCFPTASNCVLAKGCHTGYQLPHTSSLLGSARLSAFLEASQVEVAKTPGRK